MMNLKNLNQRRNIRTELISKMLDQEPTLKPPVDKHAKKTDNPRLSLAMNSKMPKRIVDHMLHMKELVNQEIH